MESYKLVQFEDLDEKDRSVIREAASARQNAYCPYSNFAVGAAIRMEGSDKVYSGANIENAALSPSMCAERAAVAKAVNDGHRKFVTVAVVANQESSFTAPCGVCRQTLCEFISTSGDLQFYLAKPQLDQVLQIKLSQLLPLAFTSYKS